MRWKDLDQEDCSVARAVSVVGDRWTLLVIRDCFMGVRRFEDFERRLRIARPVLSQRLKKLVEDGVLERVPYAERPVRYEYRLTKKGMDLYPLMVALVGWGDRYAAESEGPPVIVRHKSCGKIVAPIMACPECGERITARDMEALPGPGAKSPAHLPARIEREALEKEKAESGGK